MGTVNAFPLTTVVSQPIEKSTLTADGNLPTRIAGVIGEVTRAQLAADPALTATYVRPAGGTASPVARLPYLHVKDFGAVGNGSTDDTTAVLAAKDALRGNAVSILDTIGGAMITAYSSGVLNFGPGVFVISADAMNIYQDIGLILRGSGSRRTTNYVRAATTLLISGTSAGYGIRAYRSGGRGLTIEDMDVCYATAGFTGSVLDIMDSPGVTLNRVFLGTFGITGATRLQTAASVIRATYDEFLTANNCVFDGATDGVWFDDARTELANPFGGSITTFNQCVWYDFTNRMVRHDGLRTRGVLAFNGCTWNPISVNCVRAVDLNNVEGLCINGGGFGPSTTSKASVEWLRLANCTGYVRAAQFDDLSKAGTLDGMLEVSGNRVYGTDGFTLKGGVITGRTNEFSQGINGWTLSPTYPLVADLGPDLFKAGVSGRSYDIPADSVDLAGRINYDRASDFSVSKFRNTTSRVRILNVDGKGFSEAAASATISTLDTGRTIQATGAVAQTFALPTPTPGTTLAFTKVSSQPLTINCAGGTNFYIGAGAVKPSVTAAAADIGGSLLLDAYATVGWIVKSQVGTWVYS